PSRGARANRHFKSLVGERPLRKCRRGTHYHMVVPAIRTGHIGVNAVDGLIVKFDQPDLFGRRRIRNGKSYPVRAIPQEVLVLVGFEFRETGFTTLADIVERSPTERVNEAVELPQEQNAL